MEHEIIYCAECAFYGQSDECPDLKKCFRLHHHVTETGFCAWGERTNNNVFKQTIGFQNLCVGAPDDRGSQLND
jgi:hypothetical protein